MDRMTLQETRRDSYRLFWEKQNECYCYNIYLIKAASFENKYTDHCVLNFIINKNGRKSKQTEAITSDINKYIGHAHNVHIRGIYTEYFILYAFNI